MALIVLLTLTAPSTRLSADDNPPERQYDPPQGRIIEHEGVEYRAFTLDEWKLHGHILVDYAWFWREWPRWQEKRLSYEADLRIAGERLVTCKADLDVQVRNGEFLQSMYDAEHKLRLNIETTKSVREWVLWATVIVESLAIAALGVWNLSER